MLRFKIQYAFNKQIIRIDDFIKAVQFRFSPQHAQNSDQLLPKSGEFELEYLYFTRVKNSQ